MIFKNFRLQVVCRTLIIGLSIGGSIYFFLEHQLGYSLLLLVVAVVGIYNIIYYLESIHRKLVFFLESIENLDFTVKFSKDDKQGKGFRELNKAFNQVLDEFKEVRAEKEAHLQYLHTVVQYVKVGLISFDQDGRIGLINNAAVLLLDIGYIRNLSELKQDHHDAWTLFTEIQPGESKMLSTSSEDGDHQLSVNATELRLRGKVYRSISITNIQSELQQKEIEAWQNLAKILRHEIMNSITPIVSHVETLNEMLEDDTSWTQDRKHLSASSTDDLTEALTTIEKRSKGLLHFVDAYRSFSEIPTPTFEIIRVADLFERLTRLFQGEIKNSSITVNQVILPIELKVQADQELIDTVLINLFKNAMEAVYQQQTPTIDLKAYLNDSARVIIEVIDNGTGIIPEAQSKIFVPFYTTKEKGSGIGLALSRQIMQMHRGNLTVASQPGHTAFSLFF